MKCRSTGVLYEDPYFPADDTSLFTTEKLPFTPKWLRPHVSGSLLLASCVVNFLVELKKILCVMVQYNVPFLFFNITLWFIRWFT